MNKTDKKEGRNISVMAKLSQDVNKRVVIACYYVIETEKKWFRTKQYLLGKFPTPGEAIGFINKQLGFK